MTKTEVKEILDWYIYEYENDSMDWPRTEIIAQMYMDHKNGNGSKSIKYPAYLENICTTCGLPIRTRRGEFDAPVCIC